MVREYNFINFFRAMAAFWVLAAHCTIWGGWNGVPLPNPKIAVDLFMMISGYLMAANASARDKVEPLSSLRNWNRFWLRRFFRLAPAYYLSLILVVVLSDYYLGGYHELQNLSPERWAGKYVYDPMRINYSLTNIVLHLSFLFGLHPTYSFSTFLPDWSLSLEMQFYLAFPILLLFMQLYGFVKSAMSIGLLSIILGLAIARKVGYYEPSLLFFKLQYFISGILLFHALREGISLQRKCVLMACALILASIDLHYAKNLLRYGNDFVISPLMLLAMFILGQLEAVNKMPTLLSSIISCRITRFASETSYGVYLFHGFFISAFGLIISSNETLLALSLLQRVLVMFLFVSTSAYLTAFATYRLVELPGIHFGKRFLCRVVPPKDSSSSI